MTFSLAAILFCSLTIAFLVPAEAGDKIGNGGGVWACQNDKQEIFDLMFMDVFEARREYQLNLPEPDQSVDEILQAQKKWIQTHLKEGSRILKHIEYVEKNITWIQDIINLIPDAANKITPHPSTCRQGEWRAVQLVNFTEDFRVLVRQELFESPLMTNLERAAVYLHEGYYSFLRTEFGDSLSVRARALVGYSLSDLPTAEKKQHIEKILKSEPGHPIDPPGPTSWICGIKPEKFSPLYIAEAPQRHEALNSVIQKCKKAHNPPGLPVPDIAQPCKEVLVLCERATGTAKTKTCRINHPGTNVALYEGSGRTSLEARYEAIQKCMAFESNELFCYSNDSITCPIELN